MPCPISGTRRKTLLLRHEDQALSSGPPWWSTQRTLLFTHFPRVIKPITPNSVGFCTTVQQKVQKITRRYRFNVFRVRHDVAARSLINKKMMKVVKTLWKIRDMWAQFCADIERRNGKKNMGWNFSWCSKGFERKMGKLTLKICRRVAKTTKTEGK